MELDLSIANGAGTVKTTGASSNEFFKHKVPDLYTAYEECQYREITNGFTSINEKNVLKTTGLGVFGENYESTKRILKSDGDIFEESSQYTEHIFKDKCPEEGNLRKEANNFLENSSLKIRYIPRKETRQLHSNKNIPANTILPSKIRTQYFNNLYSRQNLNVSTSRHYRTYSTTAVNAEKQSSNQNDKSSNVQFRSKGSGPSPREKGEFGAALGEDFPKAYKPALVEKDIYQVWERNGYFKPKSYCEKRFSMVLPPPNVTGTLHLGHTLTIAIQDALARWYRMEGMDVVWIPGLDHAGIATQTVVERWLKETKKVSRLELGRNNFLKEVMLWKNEKGNVINQQLRKLGASLDWSREIFTMDQRHNEAVVEAIVRLWNAGLIYRKESIINWSCALSSAISDIEVDRLEVSGPTKIRIPGYTRGIMFGELAEVSFKVCDSAEEVVVATTRLETMPGDVALAVHPQDKRYIHLHGKSVWHPLRGTNIPIVADNMVDKDFGTGVVKVTPGHSPQDWELAQRHNLPLLTVIDGSGLMCTDEGGKDLKGMKRFDARDIIKHKLENSGHLKGVKPHNMVVPICSRSQDVVEYILKDQWFVSCKTMAEKATTALRAGLLEIEPKNYNNTWYSFLDNIRDWCISRQLWWGHRIPMYSATAGDRSVWVAATSQDEAVTLAETKLGCKVDTVVQDPDVLDTWFSSALYPLSTLGWPHETDDMKRYFPLDLMETGHDILFFWVARMVMLSTELTGQLPFKKVLLHGIICDAVGRKMSKSLGNVVNPEDVIYGATLESLKKNVVDNYKAGLLSQSEKDLALKGKEKLFPNGIPECGTDALRFTLLSHKTTSHLINFDVRECEMNHHFMNKIWQAGRFALHWASTLGVEDVREPQSPGLMDRWILSQLYNTVDTVSAGFHTADFHQVTSALKDFLYYKFCDYYLEVAKPILKEGTDAEALNTCRTLLHCLDVSLRLASPVIPYVSELLYRHLPGHKELSCMLATYPSTMDKWKDPKLDANVQLATEILTAIRSLKSVNGFHSKHVPVEIETKKKDEISYLKSLMEVLGYCSVEITEWTGEIRNMTVTNTVEDHSLVHINLKDVSKEQYNEYYQSLLRKESKIKKNLDKITEMTKKGSFSRSREEVQQKVAEQIRTLEDELKTVQAYLEVNKLS